MRDYAFRDQPRLLEERDKHRARVPSLLWECTGGSKLCFDEVSLPVRALLRAYAKDFRRYAHLGHGLLIYGLPSVGKSVAATLLAKAAISWGGTALFTSASRMRDAIRTNQMFDDSFSFAERAQNVDLLVLDDLAASHATQPYFGQDDLFNLIGSRGRERCVTVITSSLPLSTLRDLYPRLGSLSRYVVPTHMTGPDWNKILLDRQTKEAGDWERDLDQGPFDA